MTKIRLHQGGSVNDVEVEGLEITFGELKALFPGVEFSKNRVYIAPDLEREITADTFRIALNNAEIRVGLVQKEMKAGADRTYQQCLARVKQIRAMGGQHATFCPSYSSTPTSILNSRINAWEVANARPIATERAQPATGYTAAQKAALTSASRIAKELNSLSSQMVSKITELNNLGSLFAGESDEAFQAKLDALRGR